MKEREEGAHQIICAKCNVPLKKGKVHITYLGNTFPAELPRCPSCGMVHVDESTAVGKMAEIEKNLEGK
ncbi:DVU_1557 family redox protein [Petroclostridium sp. X23]|uniref:DVU_1557 family redox protein n=1 Tax=Petroclostridium sp. X23 TaxID=3045146 RepID=UPI0024ACAB71|nr:CLJU_RS11820 family redox protein [Petroclostridium sp. X23]WHH60494.1 hypothetical protein QKW49_07235 [Petroclostridium sp. X23]